MASFRSDCFHLSMGVDRILSSFGDAKDTVMAALTLFDSLVLNTPCLRPLKIVPGTLSYAMMSVVLCMLRISLNLENLALLMNDWGVIETNSWEAAAFSMNIAYMSCV